MTLFRHSLLLALGLLASPAAMAQQPAARFQVLAGGTLHVSITVQGQGGWADPQSGDHLSHTLHRTYEATTRLGAPSPALMDGVTEEAAVSSSAANAFAPTAGEAAMARALQAQIDACNGNEACEQGVATQYAMQLANQYATPGRMAAGQQMMTALASPRFLNFLPDVSGACQDGRLTINDTKVGVVTDYGEGRSARIPVNDRLHGSGPVTECGDYLSIDTERGTYSLKITADTKIEARYDYGGIRPEPRWVGVEEGYLPLFRLTHLPLPATGTALRGEKTYPDRFVMSTGRGEDTFPVTTVVHWTFTPAA
jgi:hypothetical protein